MKLVIVVDFPDVEAEDTFDLDPNDPAEDMVTRFNEAYEIDDLPHQIEFIGAGWEGSALLSALMYQEKLG